MTDHPPYLHLDEGPEEPLAEQRPSQPEASLEPPYVTFDQVVQAFEGAGLDIRSMYWSDDQTPFFVRVGETSLRRVVRVEKTSVGIIVTVDD